MSYSWDSTWCSGCSYLNCVELQNGCLALAHANLFIPSTLNGSCMDTTTGEIDQEKLKANLQAATDVYIERYTSVAATWIKCKGLAKAREPNTQPFLQAIRKQILLFEVWCNRTSLLSGCGSEGSEGMRMYVDARPRPYLVEAYFWLHPLINFL